MKKEWETKKLGEVCSFLNRGISPKYLERGGIRVLNQKCVRDHAVTYKLSRRHDSKAKAVSEERLIQVGDVLVNSTGTGTLGRVAQVHEQPKEPTTVDSHVTIVRPMVGKFYPEFFGYMMIVIEDEIKEAGDGCGGQTELARSILSDRFVVKYPTTLPEQKRIVELLDEAFAGLATAQANAEKNLQNARAIFESHLESIFSQRGEGWVEKPLDELIESNIIGLTKSSREQGLDKAWPYVKMNNITRDNRFDFAKFTAVDATKDEMNKFCLRDGDFLFNTRNSFELVGKSCIYESKTEDVVLYNNNIMRIRFKNGIYSRFMLQVFSSKAVADVLNAMKSGTTNVSAIYFKDLKSLMIPVPPIEEQKRITQKIELLSSETKRLESLYTQKMSALAALKKSLLHQAFSGEL